MGNYRITCIKKDDRQNPHKRIQEVGLDNGQVLPQEVIVDAIDRRGHTFYVKLNNQDVRVTTSLSWLGHRYIKTVNDGEDPNNLLRLMECVG